MFSNIYAGKKVFVTGDTGFKGSWLVLWLLNLGAEVCGFSKLYPSTPNHSELLALKYKKVTGDICNLDELSSAVLEFEPEIIFHLAAQPLVRKSYSSPISTFQTNVMGTANLLESVRNCSSVKAVVVITTDKCYQNSESGKPFVETDSLGGFDPYSASKGAAEIVVSSYRSSFFNIDNFKKSHNTLIATARAGNVIGGGDWGEDRLLPDIMRATSEGESVEIRSPNAVRPWQFVLEPLSGYLMLGEKLLLGDKNSATSFNFGPNNDDHKTVGEVVETVKSAWDKVNVTLLDNNVSFHEADLLLLNCDRAKNILGWGPVWGSDIAIEKTVQWYRGFYDGGELLSVEQLDCFINDDKKENRDLAL